MRDWPVYLLIAVAVVLIVILNIYHRRRRRHMTPKSAAAKTKIRATTCDNGEEMTLEELIAYHQERGADCFTVLSRATDIPEAIRAAVQFHVEAVRLLRTLEL